MLCARALEIYHGMVENLSYSIRPVDVAEFIADSHLHSESVVGIAFEDSEINQKYVQIKAGFSSTIESSDSTSAIYNCTDSVYSNMLAKDLHNTPKSLNIMCLNITSRKFREGYNPYIEILECTNQKDCAPELLRKQKLSSLRVWAFSLVDETDLTLPKTQLHSTYISRHLYISHSLQKRFEIQLREVEIEEISGIFFKKSRSKKTLNYLGKYSDVLSVGQNHRIAEIRITLDKHMKVFVQKGYYSMFGIIAFLGGFFEGVYIMLFLIVFPIREVLYYKTLINTNFSVCQDINELSRAFGLPSDPETMDSHNTKDIKQKKKEILKHNKDKIKETLRKRSLRKKTDYFGRVFDDQNHNMKRRTKIMPSNAWSNYQQNQNQLNLHYEDPGTNQIIQLKKASSSENSYIQEYRASQVLNSINIGQNSFTFAPYTILEYQRKSLRANSNIKPKGRYKILHGPEPCAREPRELAADYRR